MANCLNTIFHFQKTFRGVRLVSNCYIRDRHRTSSMSHSDSNDFQSAIVSSLTRGFFSLDYYTWKSFLLQRQHSYPLVFSQKKIEKIIEVQDMMACHGCCWRRYWSFQGGLSNLSLIFFVTTERSAAAPFFLASFSFCWERS